MDTPKPKPRRKRGCTKEGCKRGVRDGYRCCSLLCNVVTDRLEQAERTCKAIGAGSVSTAMWVSVVELGDSLTRMQQHENRVYRLASRYGPTRRVWGCSAYDRLSRLEPPDSGAAVEARRRRAAEIHGGFAESSAKVAGEQIPGRAGAIRLRK
jgi:hypothetical protein